MIVLSVEHATESLRGHIKQIFLEIKPGVFVVGHVSRKVRDDIWKLICGSKGHEGAIMIYSSQSEQGFDCLMCGNPTRSLVPFDGINLILQKFSQ